MLGWPSGLRCQTQVLVLERGRGFKSHFLQNFFFGFFLSNGEQDIVHGGFGGKKLDHFSIYNWSDKIICFKK
ncbi:hypothetical protein LINPERHAP1_LOCUS10586 [Linum perenne]